MDENERLQREAVKTALKVAVINNASLNPLQKQQALDNIDQAAQKADWIVEMLRQCGYII